MISKGRYKQAERLLRKMAKTNKRTFDEEAFQQLKDEQEKVNYKATSRGGTIEIPELRRELECRSKDQEPLRLRCDLWLTFYKTFLLYNI